MAKAVRWQIPFVSSIEKTQYRIDIYDEQDGTWSGVTTLTGGPSPIVTDEDASDDFFAPIRTQTGSIDRHGHCLQGRKSCPFRGPSSQ